MLFWLLALAWWLIAYRLWLGYRRTGSLRACPPVEGLPGLSVIVAASNEEGTIEAALRSLLHVDYDELEIIVVEDRSRDQTAAVLDRLAREYPQLHVLHIRELPPGWLGKTHALHAGAKRARHPLLLFTDADVIFERTSLRRAVGALGRADHLVVSPWVTAHTFWEKAMVTFFNVLFQLRFQPDRAPDPEHPAFIGVGAFNLIRAEAYRAIGGHAAVALDVTDDMSLGRVLKRGGYRTAVLNGAGFVRVRWVIGLRGMIHGLEKNAYAGADYSWKTMLIACGVTLLFTLGPLLHPAGWVAYAGMLVAGWMAARMMGLPIWGGLAFPLTGPILCYVMLRSAWLTERRGGVLWRGTFYPLEELRAFLREKRS